MVLGRGRAEQDSVPVPSRSPGRRLQPPTVWCATICGSVQYLRRQRPALVLWLPAYMVPMRSLVLGLLRAAEPALALAHTHITCPVRAGRSRGAQRRESC